MTRWLPLLAIALMASTAAGVVIFAGFARPDPEVVPAPAADVSDARHAATEADPVEVVLATRWSPIEGHARTRQFSRCLEDELRRPVRVVQRGSYAEANALLSAGRGDIGLVCSGATADARLRDAMVPLFRLDRGSGQGTYRSVVIVREEDAAHDLTDLGGSSIAWTDPDSLTGYRAPRAALRARGIDPATFFGAVSLTGSHDASIDAVVHGIVRAAAVDEEVFRARPPLPLRVLWVSASFPSPPVLVRPGDDEVAAALERVGERPECLADLGATKLVPADWSTYDGLPEVLEGGR